MSSGGGLVKIVGLDKDVMREFYEIEVDPDEWREFTSRKNGALIGVDIARDKADRYVWEKGEEFAMADFDGLTLYMAGTFVPKDPTLRSVILTGDVYLQEVDDRRDVANQILVKIRHRDDSPAVIRGIAALDFPIKLNTETQQVAFDQAIADLDEMFRYAGHVMVAVAVVILIGLANATSMAVRERVREVGLLRALGFSRRRIVALIATESLALALLGGIIGCGASFALLALSDMSVSVGSYSFPVVMTAVLALAGALSSAVVGILGGFPAGIRASRRPIVESLRSVG